MNEAREITIELSRHKNALSSGNTRSSSFKWYRFKNL